MLQNYPKGVESWTLYFDQAKLPVLRRTVEELARLREDEDNLSGRAIAQVVLHDPIMTVKVLRYIQTHHRGQSRATDITTIDHAIMMLGMMPFFKHFSDQPVLEDMLRNHPEAWEGVQQVISRAYHASLFAQDWSTQRFDREAEEVQVAALLHDLAEILVWSYAPEPMIEIKRRMQRQPGLRSAAAQLDVLGFKLIDLQLKIAASWHLPKLLLTLMDDDHTQTHRGRCALQAVALARHLANGWEDAALPDDYAGVAKLLGVAEEETRERILRIARKAGQDWEWFGVTPPAALLPEADQPQE